MVRVVVLGLMMGWLVSLSFGQAYELKDHRKDTTVKPDFRFDSLPQLNDSFFRSLRWEDLERIRDFTPTYKQLKSTFDTLAIDYSLNQVLTRQQMMVFRLQKQYKKILKEAKKQKLKMKQLQLDDTKLEYGTDDKKNEFCVVTISASKRKRKYKISYIAIKLNDTWFLGDQLRMEEVE
jgi:hypothetical protein